MKVSESARARRTEILRAARLCFVDRGFVRTTISDIIALSGGSRATVYAEFGDKEGLFAALVAGVLEEMRLPDIAHGSPANALHAFGISYLNQLLDPEALALYRVALGESAHVRRLGEAIFRAGPDAAAALLAPRLRLWSDQGEIAVTDDKQAARLFLAMVEGDLHRRAVLCHRSASGDEIAAQVEAAVALFLDGCRRHAS